jgi:hypothetical protein
LLSSSAADSLVGGAGIDYVSYERSNEGVYVDFVAGEGLSG